MFKHLFKLLWNKKKQNFLFLSEILVSFLVIFTVSSFLVFYYQNYSKPMGFDYKKVWPISYSNVPQFKTTDSAVAYFDNLRQSLESMPKVEAVSFASGNFPFSNSNMTTGIHYKGKKYDRVNHYRVDQDYDKVMTIGLIEGRWFNANDAVSKDKPILINETLKTAIFGNRPAAGEYIGDYDDKERMKIIGVMKDIKSNGDYWPAGNAMFVPIDTGTIKWQNNILVKVKPDADAAFEGKLNKFMANYMKSSTIEIAHLDQLRDNKNGETIIPMIIFMIIAGFLVINVALGLFGVLWYNINKRKGEIGLRRAIGASGKSVSYQLVTESLILATMALIVGCFFAIQFPLLHVFNLPANVYIIAMLLSICFIYLLVFICSLYPGKQAANIHPAIALHED